MSEELVALVLRNVVSSPLTPVFGCSWPLLYSLERVCRSGLYSPNHTTHTDVVCVYISPVHSCHMASPFPARTVSHCHDVLRVGTLPYSSIRLSVAPYNSQYSTFYFPLTSVEPCSFPSLWVAMFGRLVTQPGTRRTARRLSVSLVFGICHPV